MAYFEVTMQSEPQIQLTFFIPMTNQLNVAGCVFVKIVSSSVQQHKYSTKQFSKTFLFSGGVFKKYKEINLSTEKLNQLSDTLTRNTEWLNQNVGRICKSDVSSLS